VKASSAVAVSDDVRSQQILDDTTMRVGRCYQTGLLWKTDHIVLPMKRDAQFAQEYSRKEYVSKGYAKRLERKDIAKESDRTRHTLEWRVPTSRERYDWYLMQRHELETCR